MLLETCTVPLSYRILNPKSVKSGLFLCLVIAPSTYGHDYDGVRIKISVFLENEHNAADKCTVSICLDTLPSPDAADDNQTSSAYGVTDNVSSYSRSMDQKSREFLQRIAAMRQIQASTVVLGYCIQRTVHVAVVYLLSTDARPCTCIS